MKNEILVKIDIFHEEKLITSEFVNTEKLIKILAIIHAKKEDE